MQRLVGARTKDEREAVDTVLREFFELRDDGWHNGRCDKEIARYRDGDSDRQARKENERERQRRTRERRKSIFETLRSHDIIPKWDTSLGELEAHLSRVTGCDSHAPVTVTGDDLSRTCHAPDTASQSPLPIPHPPDLNLRTQISPTGSLGPEPPRSVDSKPAGEEKKIKSAAVDRVFAHWRLVHNHPRSSLDAKRLKLIAKALESYSEDDLCMSISGYLNSPHHMGRNDNSTVYDDIEIFLRDSKHIDAGLKLYAEPPRTDLSAQTRRIIDQTADWIPPELRRATN